MQYHIVCNRRFAWDHDDALWYCIVLECPVISTNKYLVLWSHILNYMKRMLKYLLSLTNLVILSEVGCWTRRTGRRQAIIWTNAIILVIGLYGTNFSEINEIRTFSFKKMHLNVSSVKWRPFCLALNVLRIQCRMNYIRSIRGLCH